MNLHLYATTLLIQPCLCYYHFDSRDGVARSVIEACRTQIPDESGQCYFMIRCIIDNIPSEINARWSAGASILAFIPTIVALMSNSIQETISIADESVLLAVALSVSSITAFNSRFGDRVERLSDILSKEKEWGHTNIHTALWALENMMAEARKPHPWWQNNNMQIYATSLVALVLGAGVWYEVYEITRYGIIVFACPIKANVAIWVALSQLIALLNVLCRSVLFEFHTIQIRKKESRPRAASSNGNAASQGKTQCSTIVLRCPRDTSLRWALHMFTAIVSFSMYAYGTILLASMILIPASDAIRAMVVSASGAGFARLAGHWHTSPRRRGNHAFVVDVPPHRIQDFTAAVRTRWA
ncbi:hypothetical protein JMJ35_002463 [Cladonia borealis]|uniref:Uncharacterized protein n=1 Tax=Cladonia borealis TaxID=184061 RepID=A0AA39V6W0_9LECA|nr:hypothetical protein JMJ35_002463 [Cladonia borealis]